MTTVETNVLKWTEELVRYLQDDYDSESYDPGGRYKFNIQEGRKYYKIHNGDAGGVHAFVNKKTGEVYKPASWKSPHTKYVRYDLRIIKQREECYARADWAGGYLYLR